MIDLGYRTADGTRRRLTAPATNTAPATDHLTLQIVEGPGTLRVVARAECEVTLDGFAMAVPAEVQPGDTGWFNGYQSWSVSEVRAIGSRVRHLSPLTRPAHLRRYGDADLVPQWRTPGVEWTHEVLATQRGDHARLWGSLLGTRAFTMIEVPPEGGLLRIVTDVAGARLAAGEERTLVDLVIWEEPTTAPTLLRRWAAEVGSGPRPAARVLGWGSWYQYYYSISQPLMEQSIDDCAGSGLPLRVFQIDDGYQAAVGDWTEGSPGFPGGMDDLWSLAQRARLAGFTAGIWLAPFVVAPNSKLFREHPEWIQRDRRGRPVAAGWNSGWRGTFYALDLENPAVRDHLAGVFAEFRGIGFDFFKLDFLYAASLGVRDGATRAERMRYAMGLLREWIGDAAMLACGVPLVSAAGLTEYCRIGADVEARWENRWLRRLGYRERVSTVSSLNSTLCRSWTDGTWFANDPDVALLRTWQTRLTGEERRTLLLVNALLGSLVFVSDEVARYPDSSRRALHAAAALPPMRVIRHEVTGTRHILTLGDGDGHCRARMEVDLSAPSRTLSRTTPRTTVSSACSGGIHATQLTVIADTPAGQTIQTLADIPIR